MSAGKPPNPLRETGRDRIMAQFCQNRLDGTMMTNVRRLGLGLAVWGAAAIAATSAAAGDIADHAAEAERLAAANDITGALAAHDQSVAALWATMPLHLRAATFAEPGSIEAFGRYRPRDGAFRPGDTAAIYVEPVGYGFHERTDSFAIRLSVGIEITSPGGIVFARAPQFAELSWSGRARSREIHGNIAVTLPDLKPGTYRLALTVTDGASGKAAEATLPFDIVE